MNNVWETRDRLLLEHLEKVESQIRSKESLPFEKLEAFRKTRRAVAQTVGWRAHVAATAPYQQTRPVHILWLDAVDLAVVAQATALHGVHGSGICHDATKG